MYIYSIYLHPRKSLFVLFFLQPRLCGLTNGSTRSISWHLTLSILSSYWLIMFPDTPHLWKQILVSTISRCDPYCQLILEKKKKSFNHSNRNLLFQTRFLWWLQPFLCCFWLQLCSSSSSCLGLCESLKSFFHAPFHRSSSLTIFLSLHQPVDVSHTSSRSSPALGTAKWATGWWTQPPRSSDSVKFTVDLQKIPWKFQSN